MDQKEIERKMISSLDFLEELQRRVLMGEILTTMNEVLGRCHPDEFSVMHKGFQNLLKELEGKV